MSKKFFIVLAAGFLVAVAILNMTLGLGVKNSDVTLSTVEALSQEPGPGGNYFININPAVFCYVLVNTTLVQGYETTCLANLGTYEHCPVCYIVP
jgi:hypothetical protein